MMVDELLMTSLSILGEHFVANNKKSKKQIPDSASGHPRLL